MYFQQNLHRALWPCNPTSLQLLFCIKTLRYPTDLLPKKLHHSRHSFATTCSLLSGYSTCLELLYLWQYSDLQITHWYDWPLTVILFNNNKLYINWRLKQLHKQGYNQDFLQYLELLVNLDNSLRCIFMINFGMRVVVPLYAQISKKLISGCSWFSALPW